MQKALCLIFALGLSVLASMEGYEKGYAEGKATRNTKTVIEYVDVESTPTVEPVAESETVYLGTYTVTAYCPCEKCCGKTDGITASGTKATAGRTIAADTSILPFGTELYINGQKYIVEDRGGGVRGNHIDIFFDSHADALEFGKRQMEIYKGV